MADFDIYPLTWFQLWWVHFMVWKLIFKLVDKDVTPPAAGAFWSLRGELRPSISGIKTSVLLHRTFSLRKNAQCNSSISKILFFLKKRGRFPSSQTGGCGGSPADLCRLANHPKASQTNCWRTDQTPVTSGFGTSDPAGVALMRQEITTL